MDLKEVRKSKSTTSAAAAQSPSSSVSLKSDAVFRTISEKIDENIEKAKSVNGVFLYNITKDGQIAKKWSKCSSMERKELWTKIIPIFFSLSLYSQRSI